MKRITLNFTDQQYLELAAVANEAGYDPDEYVDALVLKDLRQHRAEQLTLF